jgi:predicted ATPase
VPLASFQDPTMVLPSILELLQLQDESALAGKRLLLLFDNAEHLLPVIADSVAAIHAISGPQLVVTSRERLALHGEHLYPVPSMNDRDGVDLFVERARQLDPGFVESEAVSNLCDRLDRLPLALELAAARSTMYSPDQLLERLGDRLDLLRAGRDSDPRQQTLRTAIDWSYELLADEEQRLYRALGVFQGGCTLEAAERVCAAAPDALASLIDKSLVRRRDAVGGSRYWMLETIREHAREHLSERGEKDAVENALVDYCTDFCERALRALTSVPSDDDAVWLERLADERHNVRAALAHSRDRCDAVALSRLCASYWFAWYFVRDASDGLDWVHAALELGPPADLLPRLENAASALWLRTHGREQLDTALELARAAAQHARELNDVLAESMAVLTLGNVLSHRDEDAACEAWSQARRLAAGAVEPWWQMCATSCLFGSAIERADVEWAKTELQVMRSLVQQFGACAFFDLDDMAALVEWELGNVDVLRVRLSGWLDEFSRHDALRVEELFLLAAELAAHDGDARRAIMLIAAAYADTQAAGLAMWPSLKRESFEAALREKVSVEEWVAAYDEGRSLARDGALRLAAESARPTSV